MKTLNLTEEEFNKIPPNTIVQYSSDGSDILGTVFSEFKLSPEELRDYIHSMRKKNISFSCEDEKGNFSNTFILDCLWSDKSKNGNNTETIAFINGEYMKIIV